MKSYLLPNVIISYFRKSGKLYSQNTDQGKLAVQKDNEKSPLMRFYKTQGPRLITWALFCLWLNVNNTVTTFSE